MCLYEIVQKQLHALEQWANLPEKISWHLNKVFEMLTFEALMRSPNPPFSGLAQINPDGLPFQWSLCIDNNRPSVRFLCESGVPGTHSRLRYELSLEKLETLCNLLDIPILDWLKAFVHHAMPRYEEWPGEWFSALWFAVGASPEGILFKLYLNIKSGNAFERWKRIGWVLKALGREPSLQTLCRLSGTVSKDSWPSGLAVDILPDGKPGRVKAYFESAEVQHEWLENWYSAIGARSFVPYVNKMLEVFPRAKGGPYPEMAFFVSLEFLPDELVGLKTDLAISRWMGSDFKVVEAIKDLLTYARLDDSHYISWLDAIGAWPPSRNECKTHQLVGFGFEPDGTYHVNVYCEPPVSFREE